MDFAVRLAELSRQAHDTAPEPTPRHRGRPRAATPPKTDLERQHKRRATKRQTKLENIAILDMETDPFDDSKPNDRIEPFLAVLYRDGVDPVVIWDEERESFCERVLAAINNLPDSFTIYAHNGGKFDFLFLIHKLRGPVSFKGRGIMTAKIGNHELRDSYHIIPEKLANLEKEKFDYANMARDKRNSYRQQIIDYCIADCRGLLKFVKAFCSEFGFKLSIGQAAMTRLKEHYTVNYLAEYQDRELRQYFFGGRVECLQGRGHFVGHYKLYDVNSMYPAAMANFQHPIGDEYIKRPGEPTDDTVFLDLECENDGALVTRSENNETTASVRSGRFYTTIHEYRTALKLGLIRDVRINFCIDCTRRSNFSDFVLPLYENRQVTKKKLNDMAVANLTETQDYFDTKKDDIFYKLLLNNAYGKFAQNPRNFKESYLTDPCQRPDLSQQDLAAQSIWEMKRAKSDAVWCQECFGDAAKYEGVEYWIWERPSPGQRFNNVGTAASITGAARAILLEAIHNAIDPIYCDTDSLICRELPNTDLHPTQLGAWDLEAEFREVIVNGKKMYACLPLNVADDKKKTKIRSKGTSGLKYADMLKLYEGEVLNRINPAPTLTKTGAQYYVRRNIRATAVAQPTAVAHPTHEAMKCATSPVPSSSRIRTGSAG